MKNGKNVNWENLVWWSVRLILLVIFLFAFAYGRFYINVLFLISFIAAIIRKHRLAAVIDLLIVLLLYEAWHPYGRFYSQLETLHFHLLEKQYQKCAEMLLEELKDEEDTDMWDGINIGNPILASERRVHYMKKGDDIVLHFQTEYISCAGMAYFTDVDMILDLYKYFPNRVKEDHQYELFWQLSEHWGILGIY